MNHKIKGLHLTKRDLQFFCFLFEYKIAKTEQILKFCYPTSSITNVRYRLSRLKKLNFISSKGYESHRGLIKVFNLTKSGKKLIKEYYSEHISNFKLKSETPEHDLMLIEIGKWFSKNKHTEAYLTENILQSNSYYREHQSFSHFVNIKSDAFLDLSFKGDKYKVAVEYENSQKAFKRYEKLVSEYYLSSQVDIIFYFFKDESIKKAISKIEKNNWIKFQPKFYFFQIKNENDLLGKITLTNHKGNSVII
jgi:DNA-binding PadR family transcriptional regulator